MPFFLQSVKIRLGVYQPSVKNKKEQTRNYSLTVPSPEFKAQSLENDLMLIKLSKAAVLNSHVGTIAISMEPLAFNDSCFIPTWTWNEYKNRKCSTLFFILRRFWSWGKMWRDLREGNGSYEVMFLTLVITARTLSCREIKSKEADTGQPI